MNNLDRRTFLKASGLAAGGLLLGTKPVLAQAGTVSDVTAAARAFVESLSAEGRSTSVLAFDSPRRYLWHWFPNFDRDGLQLNGMTAAQRTRALALLEASTSATGFQKAQQIMSLQSELGRSPLDYHVVVYGSPAPGATWGWRIEGHHLSLHFTVVKGATLVMAPLFLGASPTVIRDGSRAGLRTMRREEEAGRELVRSLDADRRRRVVHSAQTPGDTVTQNAVDARPLEAVGLRVSDFSAAQRGLILEIVNAYLGVSARSVSDVALARVNAELDQATFGWSGSLEVGQRHYYRLQGRSFLLEYDNSRDSGYHIHSQWRDFAGDWGRDLL
jgi:hypothetical protein